MKGTYKFVQTVHTGPQGSVAVKVKHNYEGAVPLTDAERISRYLTSNNAPAHAYGKSAPDFLTIPQMRQIRRSRRRAIGRAARAFS